MPLTIAAPAPAVHRFTLAAALVEGPAMTFTSRPATRQDLPVLAPLIGNAIAELQKEFLDPAQIEASRAIMGLDTQLIDDGTYFVAEEDGRVAGCGGWSRRATLYGGDHSAGRDAALLDPAKDAAKIRAMYTDPAFARRGVGRLILTLCEDAARAEGFTTAELMATLAGHPLYQAAGYVAVEHLTETAGGVAIPLVRMRKHLVVGRRVLVSGLVQGVFFRDTCRRVAGARGVGGWVRNLPDGRVEAVFEGPPAAVDHLVAWSRRGPSDARVTAVAVTEEAPAGLTRFEIR
jgi:acylphosphatase/GNAT superfamily N-acetyltransferase